MESTIAMDLVSEAAKIAAELKEIRLVLETMEQDLRRLR